MDELNQPQQIQPQPQQPMQQPATDPVQPVQQPQMPKKGNGLFKIIAAIVVAAALGFGGWYAYNSGLFGGTADDNPPALKLGGAGFQGKSVETTFGFLQYDEKDPGAYQPSQGAQFAESPTGINYFWLKEKASFADIVQAIKPVNELKVLVVYYDAEKDNGCFRVYPVGPFSNTCEVKEDELDITYVDKGRSIAFISNLPGVTSQPTFEYDSTLLGSATELADSLNVLSFDGWTMHPISESMDLSNSRIRSVWAQKDQNEFEKISNLSNLDSSRKYKMLWLKLGEPPAFGSTGSTTSTTVVDQYQVR